MVKGFSPRRHGVAEKTKMIRDSTWQFHRASSVRPLSFISVIGFVAFSVLRVSVVRRCYPRTPNRQTR